MNDYLTVNEAAHILGLHPQTVYRKCMRKELPSVRFGRTLRIPTVQLEQVTPFKTPPTSIPSFMSHLFWEYDTSQIKPLDPIVFERVLEMGDLPEWRWLEGHTEPQQIRQYLQTTGRKRLSHKTFQFWARIFGVNDESQNSNEDTKKSLGKTSWR